jgi:hypothetical protein
MKEIKALEERYHHRFGFKKMVIRLMGTGPRTIPVTA